MQCAENVVVARVSCIFLWYSIFRPLIMGWHLRIRDLLLPVELPSPCFLLQEQQQQEDFKRQLNKYKNLFGFDWISFNLMSLQAVGVRCFCLSLVPLTPKHVHLFLRSSYETRCLLADIKTSLSHYKEIFIQVPRANACSNVLIIWDFHVSLYVLASLTDRCVSVPGEAPPSYHCQAEKQTSSWRAIFVPSGALSFSEESDSNFSPNQRVPLFSTAPPGKAFLAG